MRTREAYKKVNNSNNSYYYHYNNVYDFRIDHFFSVSVETATACTNAKIFVLKVGKKSLFLASTEFDVFLYAEPKSEYRFCSEVKPGINAPEEKMFFFGAAKVFPAFHQPTTARMKERQYQSVFSDIFFTAQTSIIS